MSELKCLAPNKITDTLRIVNEVCRAWISNAAHMAVMQVLVLP